MEFNFKVEERIANVILEALGELPAKKSNEAINIIQFQASEQVKALNEKKEGKK